MPLLYAVIPAQAGIHLLFDPKNVEKRSRWIPACAEMTKGEGLVVAPYSTGGPRLPFHAGPGVR